jgi:hypothetical protein
MPRPFDGHTPMQVLGFVELRFLSITGKMKNSMHARTNIFQSFDIRDITVTTNYIALRPSAAYLRFISRQRTNGFPSDMKCIHELTAYKTCRTGNEHSTAIRTAGHILIRKDGSW